MSELLTTHQVQEELQIDRTTIYRMLKDGRLEGVKIGRQWRFPRSEVDALLGLEPAAAVEAKEDIALSLEALPIHCVQAIQDVSAETVEVGAITTDSSGCPITEISNSCTFCDLILSTETGREACIGSWSKLSRQHESAPMFVTCHAGFQYARARIDLNDDPSAMLIAGQFFISQADQDAQLDLIEGLARTHGLDADELHEAANVDRVLSPERQQKIATWLERLAGTLALIGRERADLLGRLRRISAMSAVHKT